MILECPSCAVKFKIPDGVLMDAGRKVRCASCKHVWHATPESAFRPEDFQRPLESALKSETEDEVAKAIDAAIKAEDEPEVGLAPASAPEPGQDPEALETDAAASAPDTEGETSEDAAEETGSIGDFVDQTQDFVSNISKALEDTDIEIDDVSEKEIDAEAFFERRQAEERKEEERSHLVRRRRIIVGGWAALILFLGSVLTMLLFFKDATVSIFPPAKALYATVEEVDYVARFRENDGEPLSPPITEERTVLNAYIRGRPTVERIGGGNVLVVKGYLKNDGRRAATVPKVRLEVMDDRDNVLDSWEHDPKGSIITRGQELEFETQLTPVPPRVVRAVVSIIEGSRSEGRAEVP